MNVVKAVSYIKTTDISLDNVVDVVQRATDMVSETSLISFDNDLGSDFFDIDSHKSVKEYKLPYTWEYFNKISKGGLDLKTLTCYIGATNVGKCCQYDTKIRVRNKKTGEIREVSIGDFFKMSQD